jgi:hypothetical protein
MGGRPPGAPRRARPAPPHSPGLCHESLRRLPRWRARRVDWPDARRQQMRAIPRQRGTGTWLTYILVAVLGARGRPTPSLQWPGSGDSGGPLRGMSVLGLHTAPTGMLADSEQLDPGPLGKAFHVAGLPDPRQAAPLADARFLRSTSIPLSSLRAAASTLQGERSRTGWLGYGVHVISAVSFSVLPAIAHVSVRVALAAPDSACRPAGRARTSPVGTLCPPGPR